MGMLIRFFLFTYALSWIFFITVVLLPSHAPGLSALQQILIFLGAISPSLVALGLLFFKGGKGQIDDIWRRISHWKVGLKFYVIAIGYMAVIKLTVAILYKLITSEWPAFGQEAWYLMLAVIPFSTLVQAGEEIGWRGFALPRLTSRFGLPLSTIILGVIWASWHLPLFFIQNASTYGQSFFLYVLQVTAISIAMGWLYWRTQGSLLLTMLMHAAINNTKDIVPSAVPGASNPFEWNISLAGGLTLIMLWIFAVYFLYRMRSIKFLK